MGWPDKIMRRALIAALLSYFALCSACTTISLLNGSGSGDTSSVAKILQEGGDVNASFPVIGTRALMVAAAQGHIFTIKTLLDAGADVNHADKTRCRAVHRGTISSEIAIVSL